MVLLIIIPFLNGYFIGGIPHFQTYPHIEKNDQPPVFPKFPDNAMSCDSTLKKNLWNPSWTCRPAYGRPPKAVGPGPPGQWAHGPLPIVVPAEMLRLLQNQDLVFMSWDGPVFWGDKMGLSCKKSMGYLMGYYNGISQSNDLIFTLDIKWDIWCEYQWDI